MLTDKYECNDIFGDDDADGEFLDHIVTGDETWIAHITNWITKTK